MRLVEIAHHKIRQCLAPGDHCIDATAGNGFDTLFLAKTTAPDGLVYAFDIQETAVKKTVQCLDMHGLRKNLKVYHASHADLEQLIGDGTKGKIAAGMFNLGYLPGGKHEIITKPRSTKDAINQTYHMLKPGGIITVLCYRGHTGGMEETSGVLDLCQSNHWKTEVIHGSQNIKAPLLIIIHKPGNGSTGSIS